MGHLLRGFVAWIGDLYLQNWRAVKKKRILQSLYFHLTHWTNNHREQNDIKCSFLWFIFSILYIYLYIEIYIHTHAYINKITFCDPEAGIKTTRGFYPAAAVFQCRHHWSNIIHAKFSKSHGFLLQCFWSHWWQPDIIWATLPVTAVQVSPFSSLCRGAMASLFHLQNPMPKYGCVPQPMCEAWPPISSASNGQSVRGKSHQMIHCIGTVLTYGLFCRLSTDFTVSLKHPYTVNGRLADY